MARLYKRGIIGIDPGRDAGVAIFVYHNEIKKYELIVYGVCSPSITDAVSSCICEFVEMFGGDFEMVIEDQRAGIMSTGGIISLARSRERWQCLAEYHGITVYDLNPKTWQSWAYNRKRPANAKIASCRRVNQKFGLQIAFDEIDANAADAINIADCHINGQTCHGHLVENIARKSWYPKFPIIVSVSQKQQSGRMVTKNEIANIVKSTKTQIIIELNRQPGTYNIPLIDTRSTRRGVNYDGDIRIIVSESYLASFQEYLHGVCTWP